ncbi:MAG: helix-turn-helix domain-containing protein [Phycisphaerales bacterium]|nr:helix-turn-helix domain-containing protein [Phycisphaerales bacterium]
MQIKRNQPRPPFPAEVRTAAQFDAIASPVRDQILQVVVNQAPWSPEQPDRPGVSIREIGSQLGRKPGSLYRHIEALVEAGLIRETGAQPSGGRDAMTYTATGEVVHLVTPERNGAAMEALCRYIERTAAQAGKEAAAATRDRVLAVASSTPPGARGEPPRYENAMLSMFGWLDDEQRQQLRECMWQIAEIFGHAQRRPGTKLIASSLFIRPVRLPAGETAESE